MMPMILTKPMAFLHVNRILYVFLLWLLLTSTPVIAQTTEIVGEWIMRNTTLGTSDEVTLEQTGENIVLWVKEVNKVFGYHGKLEETELKLSTAVENDWISQERRDCHDIIMQNLEQYPQYKFSIFLELQGEKMTGTFYSPIMKCSEGEVDIQTATSEVELIKVNTLYYSKRDKIVRVKTNKPGAEEEITGGLEYPHSLALDKGGRRLYWVEKDKIYRINQDGSDKTLVIKAEEDPFHPKNLAIDKKHNKLFWIEGFKIKTMPLNHRKSTVLLEEAQQPNSLVIDTVNHKMYWLAQHVDEIRRSNLDGSDPERSLTIFARYSQQNHKFNLTDARLMLVHGEHFPQRHYRGIEIKLNSSDPNIEYLDLETWYYDLLEDQKTRYRQYQLWLSKFRGFLQKTK